MTAKDIMEADFVCVQPDMLLKKAAELMTEQRKLLLPVVDEAGRGYGVLMEVDLLRVVLPKYLDTLPSLSFLPESCDLFDLDVKIASLKVEDVIGDRELHTVSQDTKAMEIAHIMLTEEISSVGVEQDGKIIGIVTRGNLVRHIFDHTLCEEEQQQQ